MVTLKHGRKVLTVRNMSQTSVTLPKRSSTSVSFKLLSVALYQSTTIGIDLAYDDVKELVA